MARAETREWGTINEAFVSYRAYCKSYSRYASDAADLACDLQAALDAGVPISELAELLKIPDAEILALAGRDGDGD